MDHHIDAVGAAGAMLEPRRELALRSLMIDMTATNALSVDRLDVALPRAERAIDHIEKGKEDRHSVVHNAIFK